MPMGKYQKYSGKGPSKTAVKALNKVKRLERQVELKQASEALTATISTGGSVKELCDTILQGDGEGKRTGNRIELTGLRVRALIKQSASATQSFVRCIIFSGVNGEMGQTSPYTVSGAINGVLESARPEGMKNWTGRYNTKIHYDHTWALSSTGNNCAYFDKHIKIPQKYRMCVYNGTGDVMKGGLYMLLLSNEATNLVTFDYDTRVYYKDL